MTCTLESDGLLIDLYPKGMYLIIGIQEFDIQQFYGNFEGEKEVYSDWYGSGMVKIEVDKELLKRYANSHKQEWQELPE